MAGGVRIVIAILLTVISVTALSFHVALCLHYPSRLFAVTLLLNPALWLFMGLLGMGCAVILNYRDQQRKVHAGLCFSCRYHYGSSPGGARRRRGRCPEGRCRGSAGVAGVGGGGGGGGAGAGGGVGCVENGVGGGTRAVYMQSGHFGGLYVSKPKRVDQENKSAGLRDNAYGIRQNVLAAIQDGRYEGLSGMAIVGGKEDPTANEENDSERNVTHKSKINTNCTNVNENANENGGEGKENSELFTELITEFDPLAVTETTNVAEESKEPGVDPEVGRQVYVRWVLTHNGLISATCSCGAWDPASFGDRKRELPRLHASYASDSSSTSSPLLRRPQVEGESVDIISGSQRAQAKQREDQDDNDDDTGDSDVASGGSFDSKRESVGRSESTFSGDDSHGSRVRTSGYGECGGCSGSRGDGGGNGTGSVSRERYMKVVGRYNKRILMRCSLSPHSEVPIHLFRALGADGRSLAMAERRAALGNEKTPKTDGGNGEKVKPTDKEREEDGNEENGEGEGKGNDDTVFKRPIIKRKTKSLKKMRGVQAKRLGKLKSSATASGASSPEASGKRGVNAEASSQGTGYSLCNTSKKKSRGSSMAAVHRMPKRKGNYTAVDDEEEEEEEKEEELEKEEEEEENDDEEDEEWEEEGEEKEEVEDGYDDTQSVSSATALIREDEHPEEVPGRKDVETSIRKKSSRSIRAKLSKAMKKVEGSARPKRAMLKPAEVFLQDNEDSSLEDLILPASQIVASTFSPTSSTSSLASSSTTSLSMLIPHSRPDHFADDSDDVEKASKGMDRRQSPFPGNRRTVTASGHVPTRPSNSFRTLRVSQATHRWHLRRPQYRLSSPFH